MIKTGEWEISGDMLDIFLLRREEPRVYDRRFESERERVKELIDYLRFAANEWEAWLGGE